jgi:hypothetical protein
MSIVGVAHSPVRRAISLQTSSAECIWTTASGDRSVRYKLVDMSGGRQQRASRSVRAARAQCAARTAATMSRHAAGHHRRSHSSVRATIWRRPVAACGRTWLKRILSAEQQERLTAARELLCTAGGSAVDAAYSDALALLPYESVHVLSLLGHDRCTADRQSPFLRRKSGFARSAFQPDRCTPQTGTCSSVRCTCISRLSLAA